MRRLPTLSVRAYERIAWVALAVLTLIVFTGAAVRLTGSGLGCPDWPRCHGGFTPELDTHTAIEFGNRLLTGIVALPCLLAFVGAFLIPGPRRWDLVGLGFLLPLGVVGQAVLGGMTVLYGLAPGWVMGHHMLSMALIVAAVALLWRVRHAPGSRPQAADAVATWCVRALLPLGAVTLFAGTVATAAGPHAGGDGTGNTVVRLTWFGLDTLDWAIHQHARLAGVMGVASVIAWWLVRRRGGDPILRRALTRTCLLLAAQGVIGTVQYRLALPSEIVWVHVVMASLTWVTLLWAVAAAGRLAPASAPASAPARSLAAR